jgi:hypothetical protein
MNYFLWPILSIFIKFVFILREYHIQHPCQKDFLDHNDIIIGKTIILASINLKNIGVGKFCNNSLHNIVSIHYTYK